MMLSTSLSCGFVSCCWTVVQDMPLIANEWNCLLFGQSFLIQPLELRLERLLWVILRSRGALTPCFFVITFYSILWSVIESSIILFAVQGSCRP